MFGYNVLETAHYIQGLIGYLPFLTDISRFRKKDAMAVNTRLRTIHEVRSALHIEGYHAALICL
jgi:hypothetical protein